MADHAPERTERDITGLLNTAGHALSNRLAAALADVDLTPRMQCVLVHALEEERTQIQLAALADLDKTTMVATVDDLEARGLAERRASATDRRARIIAVTDKGRMAAEEGQRIVDRVHTDALGGLSADDRSAFVEVLARLAESKGAGAGSKGAGAGSKSAGAESKGAGAGSKGAGAGSKSVGAESKSAGSGSKGAGPVRRPRGR